MRLFCSGTNGILAKNDHIRWLQNGMILKKKISKEYLHEATAKLAGMTTIADLYSDDKCKTKCERIYNATILFQADPDASLKTKILDFMQNFFGQMVNTELSDQYQALGTLGVSLVDCMTNRPNVCPYANDMIKDLVQAVQGGKKRADHHRWLENQMNKHHDYDHSGDFGDYDVPYLDYGDYGHDRHDDYSGYGDYGHMEYEYYSGDGNQFHDGHEYGDYEEETAHAGGALDEVHCDFIDRDPDTLPDEELCAVTSIVKVKSFPVRVKSFPARVKSFPAVIKCFLHW